MTAVAACIRRNRCGLSPPNRPFGSFLFLGPVGIGKTLVAQTVAEFLFGRAEALTQIDLGEYTEPHSVARLIGSPPGYIGHENGSQLTEKVRRRPFQVLLFDELDKAHPAVQELLLGVLEGGRLTDGMGHTVDFTNTIIIMTANAPVHEPVGFGRKEDKGQLDLGEYFLPELINRLDRIVPFRRLSDGDARQIARREINKLADRLAGRRIFLSATEAVVSKVASAFNATLGARPIRNVVEQTIANGIAAVILAGDVQEHQTLIIDVQDEQITIRVDSREKVAAAEI